VATISSFQAEAAIDVIAIVPDLLVGFGDQFPFCVFRIKTCLTRDLETKQRAFAVTIALTAAFHLVVLVYRIDDVDVVQGAAAHSAHLIANRIFHSIDCELAFQDRFHAETFVIQFVRSVLRLAFVIGVRDVPGDIVAGAFRPFEKLAITTAFAAGIARRTGDMFVVAARFRVTAGAAFTKFECLGGRQSWHDHEL